MADHFNVRNAISLRPYPLLLSSSDEIPRTPSQGANSIPPASPRLNATATAASTGVETVGMNVDGTPETLDRRHVPSESSKTPPQDVEDQASTRYVSDADPYQLSTRIKSPDEITSIRTGISRRNSMVAQFNLDKDAVKAKRIGDFYQGQNENIERLLKTVDEHRQEAKEAEGNNALHYKIAVYASLTGNIILAILQVYGAAASGSLSLFTTMADALFDPLSNVTLILCHRAINNTTNARKWPQGKARIENAGNISFCFIMCAVSLVLIVVSIQQIADGSETITTPFHLPSIVVISVATVVKIILFAYCYSLRGQFSQIRILWEDHRNDIIINAAGLCTSVLGSKVRWYIDPVGAIVLSLLIMTLWLRTAWSEFQLLIGVSADTGMLQHLTYLSMTHAPSILALDTVRAWYSGPRLIVEVDVVMHAEESLRETHDVAEALQIKLESLPNVDRAYVHVDYETSHAPEHFLKKEL